MLAGKGFTKVFNVSGGINAWQSKTAIGPQDLGMDLFTGKEAPLEVLKVAYSLEQGLRDFYVSMEEKAKNQKVKDLFSKLSDIEVKHQMSIYTTYNQISKVETNKSDFEKMVETGALEGGLSTEEYLDLFKPDLNSEKEVISLAMSIEAQALDLYHRVSSKITHPESRAIVNQIADEEKVHLASLGKLMDSL
jgi:sulfur-carrier protein adenylyltransferase/sulfurtransferase